MTDVLRRAVLERAYDPNQPRRSDGKWGRGGGRGGGAVAAAPATRGAMTPEETTEALKAIGVEAVLGLDEADPVLRGEIVSSFEALQSEHPDLLKAMPVSVYVSIRGVAGGPYAETFAVVNRADYGQAEGKVGAFNTGHASIALGPKFRWMGSRVDSSQAERLHTELRHNKEIGWMGGDSVDHIIRHEMGHVFDAALGTKATAMSDRGSDWTKATRGTTATTDYGKANKGERFAEEFAVISAGGTINTPSGRAMKQLLDET